MPALRTYLIHIPTFSEYLFRLIMVCPKDRMENLDQKEREMLSSALKVQKFCSDSPFEKLLFIYTKLGFSWGITFGPTDEAIQRALDACEFQYDNSLQRLDAINVIQREQVCAITSSDVMATIMACAQNCNTSVYHLTYTSRSLKVNCVPASKKPYDEQVKEVSAAATIVNRLMLEQLNSLDYAEEILLLNIKKLKIMMSLYNARFSAMTVNDLAKITHQEDKKRYIGGDLEELMEDGFVTSDRPAEGKKRFGNTVHYMITSLGIQKIGTYHNYIWERAFKD